MAQVNGRERPTFQTQRAGKLAKEAAEHEKKAAASGERARKARRNGLIVAGALTVAAVGVGVGTYMQSHDWGAIALTECCGLPLILSSVTSTSTVRWSLHRVDQGSEKINAITKRTAARANGHQDKPAEKPVEAA